MIQVNNIINERRDITTDIKKIQRIVKDLWTTTANSNNTALNYPGPLIHVFSINILEKILETCDTLQNLTYEPHSLEIQKNIY